ncbi:MAG: 2-hydroxyacid dehydrogenase [Alphaproteobacteria bacterium]
MKTKKTVLVTRRLTPSVEARLARDYDARLNPSDEIYAPERLAAAAQGADALLVAATDNVGPAVISKLPDSVRAIATFSVGYNHIDIEGCKKRGICVTYTPDVLTDATADLTMLLILGAARRAGEGERMVRNGEWMGWAPTQLLGTQVTGKRLGILGMGRIGRAVADRARGFAMQIHYSNRTRLPADQEKGAVFHADSEAMLKQIDILSINCPATPETTRFLDKRRIELMKDGAIVVNSARGAIVDDHALIEALRVGKLASAGLDVFDREPDLEPAYRGLANTFLLPHLGSATTETRDGMGNKCVDNLDAFFAGRTPPDRLV